MSPSFRKSLLAASIVVASANFSFGVQAQESDTTVRYTTEYFAEWAPVTAQDMLNRIPGAGSPTGGFQGGGGGGRGLGAGGGEQILIDGKRMAGKGNQSSSQLARISASQVDYIEIIRGTSGDLDVRGSQIINVVLLEALDSTSLSYQLNVDRYLDHHTQPGGSVAYSGQFGGMSFLLSAEAEPRYDHYVSKETSRLGDYSLNDEVRDERIREQTSYSYTANIGYDISDKSSVRLNGLYRLQDSPDSEVRRWTTDLRVTPNVTEAQREETPGEFDNWELGGDYEYNFENGHRFKVLFITNERNHANLREVYDVSSDGSEEENLYLDSASTSRERIVRGSYSMGLAQGQNLELGAERAQTILDSSLRLGLPSTTGIRSAAFGGLVPQEVNNANSTVEEIRVEPFVVHNWQISPRMSLETSLVYELSEITQAGDVNNQRDFAFFKPKVDLRYDISTSFQVNWKAEKFVRQLSFDDFVAASDNQDNDANTQAGNANLKQEQELRTELGFEYRLPNDIGVLDGDVFYEKHIDVIERIDVSSSPTDLASASGNIGDGTVYGLNLNASIRMNMINLPNLLVTSGFNVQDSKITDPFLGVERRFANNNRGRFQLGFRHDIPSLRLNYGLNWNNRFDGNMKRYDIDDIELSAGDPNVSAFVEFVAFKDITFRFDARNATNNNQCRERQRYVGAITSGIIEEIEDQCGTGGRVLSLKINGTF
jgi:outer membrane receptor for ferrienterochelin and colicins